MSDRFDEHPAALLKQCQALALERLGGAIGAALARVPEAFRAHAERAGDRETRDLMTRAQVDWPTLRPQVERGFRDWLERVVTTAPPDAGAASEFAAVKTSWSELSLLGDDDLEIDTAAARVVRQISTLAEADLGTLEARLGLVLGKLGFTDTDNPLAPRAILEAVQDALASVQTGLKARLAILEAIGEHAAPAIAQLYRDTDALLRQKNVLPQLKYGSLPARGPARPTTDAATAAGGAGAGAPMPPAAAGAGPGIAGALTAGAGGWPAGAAAGPAAVPAAGGAGAAAGAQAFAQLQQLMFGTGGGFTSSGEGAGPAGFVPGSAPGWGSHGAAPMPAGAFVVPPGGFAPMPAFGTPGAATATALPTPAAFVAPATLDAMTRFQRADLSDAAPEVAAAVEVAMQQAQDHPSAAVLRALDESRFAQQLSPADRVTLRTLTAFFDAVVTDPRLPLAMARQIAKLQVPLAKVALLDPAMFTQSTHPVRRLLDTLGTLAQGLGRSYGPGTTLHLRVARVIDTLCDEFDQDLTDFSRAAEDVQVILGDADRTAGPAARIQALRLHDRERLLVARLAAQDAVQRVVALQRVPRAVLRFLGTEWMKLLVVSHLTKGPESEAWTGLVETMEALVWSLGEKHTHEDRKRLVTLVPTLGKRLGRGMDVIRTAPDVRDRFEAVLVRAHAAVMGLSGLGDTEKTLPGRPPSSMSTVPGGDRSAELRTAMQAAAATTGVVPGTDAPGWMPPELAPAPLVWPDEQRMHHELALLEAPARFPAVTLANVLGEGDVTLGTLEAAAVPGLEGRGHVTLDAAVTTVVGLRAGDWFELEHDTDAAPAARPDDRTDAAPEAVEARLAYLTPYRSAFLFTDRLGEPVATFSAAELAAAWRGRRVRPLVPALLTDRAYTRLIEQLRRGDAS
ncbi:MAG: DUF1631 domain-containing protein [Burkholderiales bacterium]|nr:DUF1631 domain-containing protein [Burkholderiales bacterium]